MVILNFILDDDIGMFSRVKRAPKSLSNTRRRRCSGAVLGGDDAARKKGSETENTLASLEDVVLSRGFADWDSVQEM